MRRTALLVLAFGFALLLPSAAHAVTPSAEFTGFSRSISEPSQITDLSGKVFCDSGLTYVGRVTARKAGQTLYIGKIQGTCNPAGGFWTTVQETSKGSVACHDVFRSTGQITLSNGQRIRVQPHNWDIFCLPPG